LYVEKSGKLLKQAIYNHCFSQVGAGIIRESLLLHTHVITPLNCPPSNFKIFGSRKIEVEHLQSGIMNKIRNTDVKLSVKVLSKQ